MLLLSNRWLAPTVEGTQSHDLVVMAENGIKVGFWDGTVGVPTGTEPGIRSQNRVTSGAFPGCVIREASDLLQSSSTLMRAAHRFVGEHPKGALDSWDTGCRAFRLGSRLHLTGTSAVDRQLD
jgi:hypothetical protein